MKNIQITLNKWNDYYYGLHPQIITNIAITNSIIAFTEYLKDNNILKDSKILILFKIKIEENNFRSISYLQSINFNKNEIDELIEIFIGFWESRDEGYYCLNPSDIVFTFKIISVLQEEDNAEDKLKIKFNKIKTNENLNAIHFKGYNLPKTMDYEEWGEITEIDDSGRIITIKKCNSKLHYEILVNDKIIYAKLKYKDKILLEFKDKLLENDNLNTFIRTIKNQEYVHVNGKLILKKIIKQTKFLKKIIQSSFINNNFITMDLETRTINGIMRPYAISIYDGKEINSFYLLDYNNPEEMLSDAIKSIMLHKYNNYKIYLHNFSKFDITFLITILSQLTDNIIRPKIKDGRYIEFKFNFGKKKNKINLYFRDSLLLLPSSLKELAINFNVENKGIFPYKFVNNENIPLDYIGDIPKFESFDLTKEEYLNYYISKINKDKWNLREETIKYCNQDVITLHQIISTFQVKIFELFRIDILKYPTLSSLAFAIYRSNFYLEDHKIPLIDGDIFNFIKKGYTGGAVDVYKPTPPQGTKTFRYDVNSLYPNSMKEFDMPIDCPTYFEGDITLFNEDNGYNLSRRKKPFGFFEVEVTAPLNMNIPLLQTKIKIDNCSRTIAPIGNWTDVYFSEELYNAEKYGYRFKILRGYLFNKANIFSEYVDFLYTLKANSEINSPDYTISKLLLNCLYGRFGMNPEMENHLIIKNKELNKYFNNKIISNVVDLQNGKELISFFDIYDWNEENKNNLNISVSISASITAYGRIHMSQFKTMEGITLYYSDTDNIDIDRPLDPKYIGKELGKMKLEHIFNDAVYLTPKVYGGVTDTYEYVKIKGLKNPISFNELKPLLYKDSKVEVVLEKWYRDISAGNIKIKQEVYTLMNNNLKRKLIYDENNKLVDTSPLILKNGKIYEGDCYCFEEEE